MAVKIQGQHTVRAAREVVWRAIVDPEVLARTLPGLEELKATGDNRFEGTIQLKVGPVQGQFRGTVLLADLAPPESYRLHLKGEGAPGFVDGQGALRLAADGGSTTIHYEVDAQVGGRIAGVGQRLLDSSARVLTRQALEGLDRQVAALAAASPAPQPTPATPAASPAPEAASPAASPPPPPTQAEFAARFAKGLAGELVPPERRPLIVLVALIAILGLVALAVRACGG
jgi:carbon monoxide dehydrogenase subunit G